MIKIFRNLKKKNYLEFEENWDYQKNKLFKIIDIALNNIAYYDKLKINTSNLSYYEFRKFPILTKEIIRTKSETLFNSSFSEVNEVFKNTSGGSTGEPLSFYGTKERTRHGIANYNLSLHLNGVNIYDSSVDIWGAERDMHDFKSKFNLRSFLYNKTILNSFVLSDEIIIEYVARLNKIQPKYIKAYVHSIYEIAKFINLNNITINFHPVIHCTTGPLYPEMRKEIEKAFNNSLVYNFYGSRESSAMATEIKDEEGMFVLFDNVFVEILNDHNEPVKKGEEGEIVVTTLNNYFMPLIRYKIGDRAIKGDDFEFGTLKMESVVGRTLGVIYNMDGTRIDGQFFTSLFFNKSGIKNFQLIQKSILLLELRIVKSELFSSGELNSIVNRIKKEMPDIHINIIFCKKIDLTATGKIMYVYSEI